MKDENAIYTLEEGSQLRMARQSNYIPPVLRNWPPEKEFSMPQHKPRRRPLFLMSVLMFSVTAYVYVKYYM